MGKTAKVMAVTQANSNEMCAPFAVMRLEGLTQYTTARYLSSVRSSEMDTEISCPETKMGPVEGCSSFPAHITSSRILSMFEMFTWATHIAYIPISRSITPVWLMRIKDAVFRKLRDERITKMTTQLKRIVKGLKMYSK